LEVRMWKLMVVGMRIWCEVDRCGNYGNLQITLWEQNQLCSCTLSRINYCLSNLLGYREFYCISKWFGWFKDDYRSLSIPNNPWTSWEVHACVSGKAQTRIRQVCKAVTNMIQYKFAESLFLHSTNFIYWRFALNIFPVVAF
jgi:hypothetical protein